MDRDFDRWFGVLFTCTVCRTIQWIGLERSNDAPLAWVGTICKCPKCGTFRWLDPARQPDVYQFSALAEVR